MYVCMYVNVCMYVWILLLLIRKRLDELFQDIGALGKKWVFYFKPLVYLWKLFV